jgi:hypothetical protein
MMMTDTKIEIPVHPVQNHHRPHANYAVPVVVSMRAYEVYSHVYEPQEALITGECRGGFGTGELIAFLYARSFPKEEWKARVKEVFAGMTGFA